jgi:hypothetical protein
MAIIFENHSKCSLCEQVLNNSNQYILYPPFMNNTKDKLFIFSDSGVHLECLTKNKFGNISLLFRKKYYESMPSINSICNIDGNLIKYPTDIISFGLLTSDITEELFEFNFWTVNKKNLAQWDSREKFKNSLKKFDEENKWKGVTEFNYLQYLILLLT